MSALQQSHQRADEDGARASRIASSLTYGVDDSDGMGGGRLQALAPPGVVRQVLAGADRVQSMKSISSLRAPSEVRRREQKQSTSAGSEGIGRHQKPPEATSSHQQPPAATSSHHGPS